MRDISGDAAPEPTTPTRRWSCPAAAPLRWRPWRGSSPHGKRCLVLRNGWFSFRWSQILEMGRIPASPPRCSRPADGDGARRRLRLRRRSTRWSPRSAKRARRWCSRRMSRPPPASSCPTTTCAPSAARCMRWVACSCSTASPPARSGWTCRPGCRRADQRAAEGLERLRPAAGLVMLGDRARERIDATTSSSSFACDLKKWLQIMEAYEKRRPRVPRDAAHRCAARTCATPCAKRGLRLRQGARRTVGARARCARCSERGFPSVAGRRLRGARRGRQLHHRSGSSRRRSSRRSACRSPPACRCSATNRRGLPQLPHRPVRPRQAGQRRAHRGDAEAGARPPGSLSDLSRRALIDKALFLLPGPLSLAATGVAWMLACAAYAAFNAWALRRRLAA
jgi:hypothetical protein